MQAITSEAFAKIPKGKELKYMGKKYVVVHNSGINLTLKELETGKEKIVNKAMFDHGGFIKESHDDFSFEDLYQAFLDQYGQEMDMPGSEWKVVHSTACDSRNYPTDYDSRYGPTDEKDFSPTYIEACSAAEAFLQVMMDEQFYDSDDTVKNVYTQGDELGGYWGPGVPVDCNKRKYCDFSYEGDNSDGDNFHWDMVTVTRVDSSPYLKLTSAQRKEWSSMDLRLKRLFAESNLSWAAFKEKHKGAILGNKFGL